MRLNPALSMKYETIHPTPICATVVRHAVSLSLAGYSNLDKRMGSIITLQLPPTFEFGVATSAFQIEGAWDEDGKSPSIWDTFSQTPGKVRGDVPGNVACDHYHRYPEDIALVKDLGIDTDRLSLSWSRLMPDGVGVVNQKGIDFYDRLIDDLLSAGIQPNVTLYHWDRPQVLEDRGGWPNRDIADWFGKYSAKSFNVDFSSAQSTPTRKA